MIIVPIFIGAISGLAKMATQKTNLCHSRAAPNTESQQSSLHISITVCNCKFLYTQQMAWINKAKSSAAKDNRCPLFGKVRRLGQRNGNSVDRKKIKMLL